MPATMFLARLFLIITMVAPLAASRCRAQMLDSGSAHPMRNIQDWLPNPADVKSRVLKLDKDSYLVQLQFSNITDQQLTVLSTKMKRTAFFWMTEQIQFGEHLNGTAHILNFRGIATIVYCDQQIRLNPIYSADTEDRKIHLQTSPIWESTVLMNHVSMPAKTSSSVHISPVMLGEEWGMKINTKKRKLLINWRVSAGAGFSFGLGDNVQYSYPAVQTGAAINF